MLSVFLKLFVFFSISFNFYFIIRFLKKHLKYLLSIFFILFCMQSSAQNEILIKYIDTLNLHFKEKSKTPDTLFPNVHTAKTVINQIPKKNKNTYNLRYEKKSILDTLIEANNTYKNTKTPIEFTGKVLRNYTIVDLPELFYKDNAKSNIKYTDIAHGFFSNSIFDINQTSDGKIWFVSEFEGIAAYNGRKLSVFDKLSGLPSDITNCSHIDSEERLWIGTSNGICYIHENQIYTSNQSLEVNVLSITEDKSGNIWFGTFRNGLFRIENDTLIKINKKYIKGFQVNALHADKDGNLWIGTNNFCVAKYDKTKFTNYMFYPKRDEDVCIEIHENETGLWLSFFDKPLVVLKNNQFYECYFNKYTISRSFNITQNSQGMWLADYRTGLYRFDNERNKAFLYDESNGISTSFIFEVFTDNNNNVWVGSLNEGIYRIDNQAFTENDRETETPVLFINQIKTVGENIWYLPVGNTLTKETKNFFYQYHNVETPKVGQLRYYTDAEFVGNDSAWFTTFGQGLMFITPQNYKFYIFDTDNYFSNVSTFDNQEFWFIAFNKGLVKYKENNFTLLNETCGLQSNKINYIMHDNQNRVWAATEKNGVNIIHNQCIAKIDTSDGLSDNRINYIFQDSKDLFWIGTEKGVSIIKNNKISSITKHNGIISNNIKSIVEDNFGNIWLSTNLGISKLTKTDTNHLLIKNYGNSYGLFMNDFFSLSILLNNNKLIFGKREHFVTYNSDIDNFQTAAPILNFDKIIYNSDTIFNPIVTHQQLFEVEAGNYFHAAFTGILWNAKNSLNYAYFLINSDNDTILTGKPASNYLQIGNVKPGKYKLIIQVQNSDGKSDCKIIYIKFLPYWWQTVWAFIGLLFIVSIFVVTIIKIATYRQKVYQRTLENEVSIKTSELIEKNQINETLLSEVHHRVKNNMQKISSLIHLNLDFIEGENKKNILLEIDLRLNTMALVHEMLYSKPNFELIPLNKYIEELATSIDNTLNTDNLKINYVFDIPAITLNISNAINLGMFTNEAITNAIKYAFNDTENPEIRIKLFSNNKDYIFSIKDNGKGIEGNKKSAENSLGLKLFDIFARQLDAELKINSKNGTEVKLIIPFKNLL